MLTNKKGSLKKHMTSHIFYLEDNDVNYLVAESMLELMGITDVRRFHDISEISKYVEQPNKPSPDLLLLDLMLPDGCSSTILPKLREAFDCPIVCFTARTGPDEISSLIELGFDDVFTKPVAFADFEKRTFNLLQSRG